MHGELRKRIRMGGLVLCAIGVLFILISILFFYNAIDLHNEARERLKDDDIKKYIEKNSDSNVYCIFGLLFSTGGASVLICGITLTIIGKPKKFSASEELDISYKDGLLTDEEYAKAKEYLKILENRK